MSDRPNLVVTQDNKGRFECVPEGAMGSPIVGRGASVLEAVGAWALHQPVLSIRCEPPAVLQEFAINNDHNELEFNPPHQR